jgi:hypothetical protein
MTMQLGPPPPQEASVGLHLHYGLLRSMRRRTHLCDHTAALLECAAFALLVVSASIPPFLLSPLP